MVAAANGNKSRRGEPGSMPITLCSTAAAAAAAAASLCFRHELCTPKPSHTQHHRLQDYRSSLRFQTDFDNDFNAIIHAFA